MIRRPRSPEALWLGLLWVIAWGAVWALIVMERILELHEGPPRTALIVLGFCMVAGCACLAARKLGRSRLRYLPLLVLALVATREGFRQLLRRQYAASAPLRSVGPSQSLWHPVTTTDLGLRYYALGSRQLAAARLRVVMLTDLHVTRALPRAYYDKVVALVAAQDADLILLAGDYVSKPENLELIEQLFARPWPARFGTYAVLGNHDYWTDAARIRAVLGSAGVSLVGGRCQHLPRSMGRVAICGTEAPWGSALSSVLDPSELNLVLSHTPDNVYHLAQQGASLVFSGHTHGGQIRVPGLGAVVVPSRFGRMFDEGHFRVDGADLFVSAGVGADMPALRLYCPPEILVVDISRE
jgi:predicted MPP superfamily phosphohydrolase